MLNFLKQIIRTFLSGTFSESRNPRFALGQSSLLASRAASPHFKNLWDAEVKVYSQWGEDGILDFLVSKLGISKPKVLEIGAGNFTECNSRFLVENLNASVVAIDGRKDLLKSIDTSELKWKSHILGIETWVTPENINALITQGNQFMQGIDVFSLDLDGNDYWIIEKAELSNIKVIVVEYNPLFGRRFEVTVPRDDAFDRTVKHESWLYFGASLLAFVGVLKRKGFTFVGTNRVGNNAFFIASDKENLIPFKPDPTDSVYYDWRIRESRGPGNKLNFLSGLARQSVMSNLQLVDLVNNKLITVGECNKD